MNFELRVVIYSITKIYEIGFYHIIIHPINKINHFQCLPSALIQQMPLISE